MPNYLDDTWSDIVRFDFFEKASLDEKLRIMEEQTKENQKFAESIVKDLKTMEENGETIYDTKELLPVEDEGGADENEEDVPESDLENLPPNI